MEKIIPLATLPVERDEAARASYNAGKHASDCFWSRKSERQKYVSEQTKQRLRQTADERNHFIFLHSQNRRSNDSSTLPHGVFPQRPPQAAEQKPPPQATVDPSQPSSSQMKRARHAECRSMHITNSNEPFINRESTNADSKDKKKRAKKT